jgi:V-type H+-transporting ATPase subunit E
MDKELFIRAREADFDLVETASKEAAAEFEKTAGYSIETEVDKDSPLGTDRYISSIIHSNLSVGGVIILGHGGKIEFDNTLEERLKLLESAALPKIRATIFGYRSILTIILTLVNPSRGNFLISRLRNNSYHLETVL